MLKVELVSYMPNPIHTIESAASNCYDSKTTNGRIVDSCYKSGHMSVLEFAQFQFKVSGISRACSHQLVRHRTGKFAQRSQRYVDEDGFSYITPPCINNNDDARNIFDKIMTNINDAYLELKQIGIPAEDARYVLPNACDTTIEISFDLRNLIHFCNERLCSRAQWEIRAVAKEMARLVSEVEPKLSKYLVPKCEVNSDYPFCTERRSCGRHPKLESVYNNHNSSNNFILLVGASGSGKTTISNYLRDNYQMRPLVSYTTRQPRYEGEDNHIFVSLDEFWDVRDYNELVGWTIYDNNYYCATREQVENSDIYTVDPYGISYFKEHYKGKKNPIVVYLNVSEEVRLQRMDERGDRKEDAEHRVIMDSVDFYKADELADVIIDNVDIEKTASMIYNIFRG